MLLDHINKWVRVVRQELSKRAETNKRSRANVNLDEQLLRVDSILSSIDQALMAKAAFKCKAFARSLMNFEQQVITIQERDTSERHLSEYYEKLHEIYAQLDEPDGMEGISTLILAPTLEHQIREHESTGRWTSAQSCWEVRLQESPDNVEFHLGLLRCLRNLGHYGLSNATLPSHGFNLGSDRYSTNTRRWRPYSSPRMGKYPCRFSSRERMDGGCLGRCAETCRWGQEPNTLSCDSSCPACYA